MPTRRLPDSEIWKQFERCTHPDHNPPDMRVFEPGTYEHTCPRCGTITIFTVPPKPSLSVTKPNSMPEFDGSTAKWRFLP